MSPVLEFTRPRVCWVPEAAVTSSGQEAAELAGMAGLELDGWQQFVLEGALGERDDGKWAAFEVGVEVSRQNGKGGVGEARVLAGLFLLGERLLIWSAHQFDTSLEAFRRILFLIEDTPEFDQRVQRVSRSHGEEGIELKGGQRLRFRTRTKGGGRGFTGDCLILDEAMILPEASHGALLPTLSARPNPQVWYMGSAVDQLVHQDGVVFARVRDRAIKGGDPGLAYFGWGADVEHPSLVTAEMAADPEVWAAANPALDIRISREHVERERLSMDPRTFAVERLGVGDWPAVDGSGKAVIDLEAWRGLTDPLSVIKGGVWFAFDVAPDRSCATITAAGYRPDGSMHIEVVDARAGVGWVPGRLREVTGKHESRGVYCDGVGPAASLVPACVEAGVMVVTLSTQEYVQACGHLYDRVQEKTVRHLGTRDLEDAIKGAVKRPLVDAWAWSRRSSAVDISPLVAGTVALWKAASASPQVWAEAW